MTLHFQFRREDLLAFMTAYHATSPAYKSRRIKLIAILPTILILTWTVMTVEMGFDLSRTIIYLGGSLLWILFYTTQYDRRVQKHYAKAFDQGSYDKTMGPCELTLSEAGLHSKSALGESNIRWSAVERTLLTDTYLFIILNGGQGYPIPISDVGQEAAIAAQKFVSEHQSS